MRMTATPAGPALPVARAKIVSSEEEEEEEEEGGDEEEKESSCWVFFMSVPTARLTDGDDGNGEDGAVEGDVLLNEDVEARCSCRVLRLPAVKKRGWKHAPPAAAALGRETVERCCIVVGGVSRAAVVGVL